MAVSNLTCILGNDDLLIDNEIDKLRKKLGADIPGKFEIMQFRPADTTIEEIIKSVHMPTFFSSNRLIIIKDIENFLKKDLDELLGSIEKQPPQSFIIVTTDNNERAKILVKFATIDLTRKRREDDVVQLLSNWMKKYDLQLDSDLIGFLVVKYKDEPAMLKTELAKIRDYFSETRSISMDRLRGLTSSLSEISLYDFIKTYRSRDVVSTIEKLWRVRNFIEHHSQIVTAITNQLIYSWRDKVMSTTNQKGRFSHDDWKIAEIVECLKKLYQVDKKIKAGTKFPYQLLELFIFEN